MKHNLKGITTAMQLYFFRRKSQKRVSDDIRIALYIFLFFYCPGPVADVLLSLLHEMSHTLLIPFD